jgi:hypothetical protein
MSIRVRIDGRAVLVRQIEAGFVDRVPNQIITPCVVLARHFFAHIADSESGLPAPCGLITAVGSSPVLNFEEEEQGRAGSRVISGGWMRALCIF